MHPLLNIAVTAARNAGNIIIRAYDRRDRLDIQQKTHIHDLVTNIDRAVEEEIINSIQEAYPQHNILSEESGAIDNNSDTRWIIDPIDGTYNFIRGIPYFAVSIAVEIKGTVEHGVVYNPITNELYCASRGNGAQLNDHKIRVHKCNDLHDSFLAVGFACERIGINIADYLVAIQKIMHNIGGLRNMGAASLELAQVACGRYDGYFELGLKQWDVAAGQLLVLEAGGFVSDYCGEKNYPENGIVATTTKIHHLLIQELKKLKI